MHGVLHSPGIVFHPKVLALWGDEECRIREGNREGKTTCKSQEESGKKTGLKYIQQHMYLVPRS